MYIITDNDTNRIIAIGELIQYQENDYPIVQDTNGNICAYPTTFLTGYEIEEIPEEIESEKYCYNIEQGFYINENYNEQITPYGINKKLYDKIIADYINKQ
jgi:hypothetical protein